jgi:hypothetical protein
VEGTSRREGHIGAAHPNLEQKHTKPRHIHTQYRVVSDDHHTVAMASNGPQETFAVPNVLAAMLTMRSTDTDKKKVAVDYLGRFQKSVSRPAPGVIGEGY